MVMGLRVVGWCVLCGSRAGASSRENSEAGFLDTLLFGMSRQSGGWGSRQHLRTTGNPAASFGKWTRGEHVVMLLRPFLKIRLNRLVPSPFTAVNGLQNMTKKLIGVGLSRQAAADRPIGVFQCIYTKLTPQEANSDGSRG